MNTDSVLLIIGNGMATNRLLETLDTHHHFASILVLSDEPARHYNRIMLSPLLAGETDLAAITPHDDDWYSKRRIQIFYGESAVAVNTQQRNITCASGLTLSWTQLIFATGSRSFIPSVPGAGCNNVLGFRTLQDVQNMQARLPHSRHATVVGAGLLGVEAAVGLQAQGLQVTLMHRNPVLMNRQLDSTAAQLLHNALRQRGIQVRTGCGPEQLLSDNGQEINRLLLHRSGRDTRQTLATDLVIFATGIIPNTELAAQAGIACNKGIQVNEYLQTSLPDIYALGECCEFSGTTYGLVAPIWHQVQVLSQVLLQQPASPYYEQPQITKLKVSGLDIHSIGDIHAGPDDGCELMTLLDEEAGLYKKLVLRHNRIIGALCVGDVRHSQWYFDLLMQAEDISDQRLTLLFGPQQQPEAA